MTTKPSPAPRLLSVDDIARFMAVSTKTVRRMIERGELPVHRIGRQLRVAQSEVERYLAGSREGGHRMTVNVQ